MDERIEKELKRISTQMQSEKNPDNIVIMEAYCEIQDLSAKYQSIVEELLMVKRQRTHLMSKIKTLCEDKWNNTDICDDSYRVGFLDCTNEILKLINEVCGE